MLSATLTELQWAGSDTGYIACTALTVPGGTPRLAGSPSGSIRDSGARLMTQDQTVLNHESGQPDYRHYRVWWMPGWACVSV